MKTFVMGDSHGGYKAFLQCLERSGFDKEKDTLICLGDTCDGYPEVRELIDELLTIKNLIFLKSNHDEWTLEWMQTGYRERFWVRQGGRATLTSYGYTDDETIDDLPENIPQSHINLIKNAHWYYLDDKNRLFVHGGIDPNQKDLEKQNKQLLIWDRDLVAMAKEKNSKLSKAIPPRPARKQSYQWGGYNEIFVGHTSTTYSVGTQIPTKLCNVWMLDTGGGWEGRLTIMDIDTHEYWQSDLVSELYPGHIPRGA